MTFDSEYTIEFCFYYYDISIFQDILLTINSWAYEVYGMMVQIQLDNAIQKLDFIPFSLNTTNKLFIEIGSIREWQCITAAASFEKSYFYLANFYKFKDPLMKQYYFDDY